MREIKFRAWSVQQNRVLEPKEYTVELWYGHYDVRIVDISTFDSFHYEREPKPVLMQYTGLKDKNGKEIYEGDILDFNAEGSRWNMVVEIPDCFTWEYESSEYEIIGNIYENPELISKTK